MALNKQQTSVFTKIFIGLIIGALVIALAGPSLLGWLGLAGSSTSQTSTLDGAGALDQIAATYAPTAQSFEQAIASDPTSYTALVVLGNTYTDWAFDVAQAAPNTGAELPMRAAAISYYERARELDAADPGVGVDLAIAYFYSGDTSQAVGVAEGVIEQDDTFVPAYFNIAIFYDAAGNRTAAVAAAERYKELDPNGEFGNPDIADQIIAGGLE